jgi:hypothetical protein
MRINNCNCGRKINCGCGILSFDQFLNNQVSIISVGNLVSSNNCNIQEYVIDWYKDDVKALTTGIGFNTDINAKHPLMGTDAVPMPPGLYTPVIRYIVVDGVHLKLTPSPCNDWCELEVNLPDIQVENLTCDSRNLPISNAYAYSFVYKGRTEVVSEPRTIIFDMSGSVDPYLAISFTAVLIPDQIDVYFNDLSTVLTSRISGQTNLATNLNVTPMRYATAAAWKFVLAIPAAVDGKREVIIKITPSILHPTVKETDWSLALACLSEAQFNPMCGYLVPSFRDLDFTDWYAIDNTALCRREYGIRLTNIPVIDYYATGLNTYTNSNNGTSGDPLYNPTSNPYASLHLTYSKSLVNELYNPNGWSIPSSMQGKMTYKKVGMIVTFTFTNLDDFNYVKDDYDASLLSPWWTNRELTDTTKIAYYRRWYWLFRQFDGGCLTDPLGSNQYVQIFQKWPIVFNSGSRTITITCSTISNNLPVVDCDFARGNIDSEINTLNSFANLADFEYETDCFYYRMFHYATGYKNDTISNVVTSRNAGYILMSDTASIPCALPYHCQSTGVRYFYLFSINVVIDIAKDPITGDFPKDGNGVYIKDPLKWFTIWNRVDKTTFCSVSNVNMLLKVEDGIVVHTQQWNAY